MDTLKYPKFALLEVLNKNRQEHRAIFIEAQDGFRKRIIEAFEQRLEEARAGKRVELSVRLTEPVDQTKDYDRVIRMLEMTHEDEVELSENEFAQYVMDDWRWKDQFMSSNSLYSATAKKMSGG